LVIYIYYRWPKFFEVFLFFFYFWNFKWLWLYINFDRQNRFLFSRLTGEIVVFLQTGCFLYPSKFKRLRTVLEEILVTNEEKQIIVALSQQGYSSYKISEMTGKNRRTTSKFLRRRRVRGSEENLPRSGRGRKTRSFLTNWMFFVSFKVQTPPNCSRRNFGHKLAAKLVCYFS
jgi:hypothetical protein